MNSHRRAVDPNQHANRHARWIRAPRLVLAPRLIFALFLPILSCFGQAATAGVASGTFSAQGGDFSGVIAPSQAAAYVVREQYDARRKVVEIVLSDTPLDAAAAAAAPNPHVHAINQEALIGKDYVLLWLSPDGQLSMNATFGKTMTQFLDSSGSALQASVTVNTPQRVAGRLFSVKSLKTMAGGSYTVDISFDTEVSRLPPGKALPKGGGAPGKALLGFVASAKQKRWPAIKAGVSPTAMNTFAADYRSDKENAEYAHDLIGMWLPKSRLKITGGELRGDQANLSIEGDMQPGLPAAYLARMRKNGNTWQFETATLLGLIKPR